MAAEIRRVCVFTGSRPGGRPAYIEAARALGGEIARRGMGLVYGGASVGLMGALADAALAGRAEIIGVIPNWLVDREIAHHGLADLRVVASMHERKEKMADLADAFVALPGGFGTFDELFEIVTWAQLGLHAKPIGLLDVAGYFEPVRALVSHVIAEGFAPEEHRGLLLIKKSPAALLDALAQFTPPPLGPKWTDMRRRA
jgi:uncharacterized protein (TIGR00730 family)